MTGMRPSKLLVPLLLLWFVSMAALAGQPVITGVSIPDVSMKINDVVTATISVESDSETVYTLNASNIGGYALDSLSKQNDITYTTTFTVTEGGTDYAAAADIAVSVELADGGLTNTWTTPILQANDPIDANRPTQPAAPNLDAASDNGHWDDDAITNDNTPTFSGAASAAEGNSTVDLYRDGGTFLGTTTAAGDGSWSITSTVIPDGTYNITITATDAAGNTSTASDPLPNVVIDTQDPDTPGNRSPADNSRTNDTSPTFSWTEPADPGGSGIYNYRVQIWGPPDRNYYTTGTSYTPTLATGTFTWRLYAIDVAGNNGDVGASNWTLVIDTTKPSVLSVTPSSLADVDAGPVTITIIFDEDMNQTVNPTVTVEDLFSSSYATSNPAWTDATHFACRFEFVDDNDDTIGQYHISGAQDLAGNTMDPDNTNAVDVDTENPTITSITSSTPDGCYNVGDDVNVTVAFSENVTCSGDFFQVPLDTGDVIQWGAFALTDTISGTYGVGSEDNSCDLDSGIPSLAGVATLKDAAGNDVDLVPSPPTSIANGSNITVDTTAPVINPIASAETVECDGEGNVTYLNTWLNSHGGANATDNCSGVTWTNDFTGLSDDCGETGSALVTFTATDDCGLSSTTQATFTIEDTTPPSITTPASNETVECDGAGNTTELNAWLANHGGAMASDTCCGTDVIWSNDFTDLSDDCGEIGSALVTFTATDCCGLSSTIQATFTIEDTTPPSITTPASDETVECDGAGNTTELNAWLANHGDAVASETCCGTDVTWGNDFTTLSDDCGETGSATVTFTATDACGNFSRTEATFTSEDTTKPVINALVVDDHVLVSADCCETTVTFTANVTDQCCIVPDNVAVTVTLPTDNAILENIVVNRVQNGQGRVDITGSADVRCLTNCPARVEVYIEATDCCGNNAIPVTSTATEGRVYDETAPEPKDDPNGDEDRSASDNLEVRSDDYGQHRLMIRQDTPVRIDVVYNDSDNCSTCTCEKHLWIDDIVTPSGYGTATIEDSESSVSDPGTAIRYAPYHGYYGKDEFTYRIVDACGNVSQEASVFIEVIAQTVMEDLCLTTCVDTAVSFDVTATDLWIDPDSPGEIPFVFSIVTPPMHGVISGDLGAVTYATHGGIESATITLIYTPAAGFVGRDVLTLRFADPFGGSSTAMVDIAVIECAEQPGAPPLFILQQGEIFPLIVPLTFAVVYEAAWETVTLIAETDGAVYQGTLSATWEESIGRYVLKLDTAALPPGLYQMTIPLGNGETVTLMIQVGEAE